MKEKSSIMKTPRRCIHSQSLGESGLTIMLGMVHQGSDGWADGLVVGTNVAGIYGRNGVLACTRLGIGKSR